MVRLYSKASDLKIRAAHLSIKITIRADSGFSCPAFYQLADDYELLFVIGLGNNEVLKRKVKRVENVAKHI